MFHVEEPVNRSDYTHFQLPIIYKKNKIQRKNTNNSNSEDDQEENYDVSVWLSNSSSQREFLLSDDEDSIATSCPESIHKIGESKLKSNSSNNALGSRSVFGGCKGNHNMFKMSKYLALSGYSFTLKSLTVMMIFLTQTLSQFWNGIKNFSGERTWWKVPLSLPMVLLERLYCFCSINECRRINIRTFFSLPTKRDPCADNDEIITKCSWPMWAIGIVILLIFILGCYYSGPNATISQRYHTGLDNLKSLYTLVLYNIYNLPGNDCMIKDNCCVTGAIAFKRWFQCFLSLPYRVSLFGMKVESSDMTVIDESLQNLSDWRLRRNIYRMKNLLEELRRKVAIFGKKIIQADQVVFSLRTVAATNLSSVQRLIFEEEQLELIYDDNIKKYEQLESNLKILSDTKNLFEKTAHDARNCAKCTSRKISTELEKTIGDDMKIVSNLGNRIKAIEKSAHRKIGFNPINKEFDKMRNGVTTMEKCIIKWQSTVSQLESLKITFNSDMELLRHHVNDLTANEMERHSKINTGVLERVAQLFSDLHGRVDHFYSQQKVTTTHLIVKRFAQNGQFIFNDIMKEFCPKIREFVKLTVQNTMTVSNTIKSCGIFDSPTLTRVREDDVCGLKLNECLNETIVGNLIKKLFEQFYSDSIGVVDYALKNNGGEILESHSTPSLHVEMFDDDQEVSESNWPLLNLFITNPPVLVNTINFVNVADNEPGKCWRFRGNKGITIIKLLTLINVNMVTIDHIYSEIALAKNIDDALKDFEIIAIKNPNDMVGVSMGSFTFNDVATNPIQQFIMRKPTVTQHVKVIIKSNHGADTTCVYRIRVHGTKIDP